MLSFPGLKSETRFFKVIYEGDHVIIDVLDVHQFHMRIPDFGFDFDFFFTVYRLSLQNCIIK